MSIIQEQTKLLNKLRSHLRAQGGNWKVEADSQSNTEVHRWTFAPNSPLLQAVFVGVHKDTKEEYAFSCGGIFANGKEVVWEKNRMLPLYQMERRAIGYAIRTIQEWLSSQKVSIAFLQKQ